MELSGITLGARERAGLGPSRIGSGLGGWKGLSGSITVIAMEGDTDVGRTLDERLGSTDGAIDAARLCALEALAALESLPRFGRELTLDARLGADDAGTATAPITPYGPEATDDALDALLGGLWCPGAPGTTSA